MAHETGSAPKRGNSAPKKFRKKQKSGTSGFIFILFPLFGEFKTTPAGNWGKKIEIWAKFGLKIKIFNGKNLNF